MPTIMPNVRRSRCSWRNSLRTMPHQRENENSALIALARVPKLSAARLHQVDEHVFEPGLDRAATRAACRSVARRSVASSARGVAAGDVQRRAEGGRSARRPAAPQLRRRARPGRRRSPPRSQAPGSAMTSLGRALRQQPAVRDVGELVAALGLVHVVRADEHRDAARGERVQLLPEFAARLGIDAGGRLVEQQQLAARAACTRRARGAASSRPRACPASCVARAVEAEPLERAVDAPRGASRIPYMRATKSRFSRIVRSSQNEKRCVM